MDEKTKKERKPEEKLGLWVLGLADLAEELMEHEGIDRTYILEALISDLRGEDRTRGLEALKLDRTGR
jgi:hypothetical protein